MKKSIVFVIICVCIVIGVYIVRYLDAPVETCTARFTEYEESVVGEAYFVREENVYNASASGTFYTYAPEGARVGKNRLIAAVYNGIVDSRILQELDNLDKKISELEEYSRQDIFMSDESDNENRLKNMKNQIIKAAEENDPSSIAKIKNNIKSITSGFENIDLQAEIDSLNRQKISAEGQISAAKYDIYSDCSGVFSSNIDGLENFLTVDRMEEYTVDDFAQAEEKFSPVQGKTAVMDGEAVCKVIDNHVWYVMVKLPLEKTEKFANNQKVIMRFDSIPGVEADARVLRISAREGDDDALVLFECEKYIEGIFSARKSMVEIVSQQYRGFEIPIYAVRVRDGRQGVMVQYGVNEIFKPCKVIFTNSENDTAIIESITEDVRNPLEQYDKIVLGEKAEKNGGNDNA